MYVHYDVHNYLSLYTRFKKKKTTILCGFYAPYARCTTVTTLFRWQFTQRDNKSDGAYSIDVYFKYADTHNYTACEPELIE